MTRKRKDEFQELLDAELSDPAVAASYRQERAALRLAIKIQTLRKAHGLTQAELARRVGTTQSAIARLESDGYRGHSTAMLARVAKALDMRLVVDFLPVGREGRRAA